MNESSQMSIVSETTGESPEIEVLFVYASAMADTTFPDVCVSGDREPSVTAVDITYIHEIHLFS